MELYVHIPFCRSKCRYCDFASWAGQEQLMPAYVDAVTKEAAQQAARLTDRRIETVFIGGGTPSTLPAPLFKKLLEGIFSCFDLLPGAEFTVEANPGTLTEEWLDTAVRMGVNRLSLGMQAYQPEMLQMLGRIHEYSDVADAVAMARAAGIENISLDLMFGLPGQTMDMWMETLEQALRLHPRHLSCYGLIPEPETPLLAMLESGALSLPDEELERAMYDYTLTSLAAHGFEQYEISNFAQPGHACSHNIGYWTQVPYLGLGASAASMLPKAWHISDEANVAYWRAANPRSIRDYIAMVSSHDETLRSIEPIFRDDARFETWMLGLRTTVGVSEEAYQQMHGEACTMHYGEKLQRLEQQGLLAHTDGYWRLTRHGMDIQNTVLVELMDD